MSFEHPNRNNESMRDVELDIMSRPPEHNTTNLDLDRMSLMLDILGHPEQSFRVIHITGTNGKGSTARMAEAICRALSLIHISIWPTRVCAPASPPAKWSDRSKTRPSTQTRSRQHATR